METVEIVVFLVVTLIIGVLTIGFLTSWDISKSYTDIKNNMIPDKTIQFTIDDGEFATFLYGVWEDCGFGEVGKETICKHLFEIELDIGELDQTGAVTQQSQL